MEQSIYQEHGFANRNEYLKHLAQEHGKSFSLVKALADILGENEDFDGLVTSLQSY